MVVDSILELNKIYNMDCIDGMKQISDKSVDLVLTDPPYGIGENNERNLSRGTLAKPGDYGHYEWDKKRIEKKYFDEIFRISKNQIIFGGNYYIDFLHPSMCWIVWDKDNGGCDFADCELAWTSFNKAVRKFKWKWHGFFQEYTNHRKEKRYHPTQKPLALFEWILEKYSKPGDLILDPFVGSGTTAIACKKLKRNFICIDINPKYCDITNDRLDKVVFRPRKVVDLF